MKDHFWDTLLELLHLIVLYLPPLPTKTVVDTRYIALTRTRMCMAAESIAKEMYRVHKYDLERGDDKSQGVSVCLFDPGAIT